MTNRDVKEWTLEDVEDHFSSWRAKRPRPRNIPDELWGEALGLLSQHSVNKVVKTLGLNRQSLRVKAKAAGIKVQPPAKRKATSKATEPTFLETSLETVAGQIKEHSTLRGWNLSIKRPDGLEMILSGDQLSETALPNLIIGFCHGRA